MQLMDVRRFEVGFLRIRQEGAEAIFPYLANVKSEQSSVRTEK